MTEYLLVIEEDPATILLDMAHIVSVVCVPPQVTNDCDQGISPPAVVMSEEGRGGGGGGGRISRGFREELPSESKGVEGISVS